jgi:hypothetical protein
VESASGVKKHVLDYCLFHPASIEVLDRPVCLPSLAKEEPVRPMPEPPPASVPAPVPPRTREPSPAAEAPVNRISRVELAKALEDLAQRAGGYEAIQTALDFLVG